MPQFDTLSFFSQVSWVFLTFGMTYLAVSFFISPTLSTIIKLRNIWSESNSDTDSDISFSGINNGVSSPSLISIDLSKNIPTALGFLPNASDSIIKNFFSESSSLKPFISSAFFFGLFRSHLF